MIEKKKVTITMSDKTQKEIEELQRDMGLSKSVLVSLAVEEYYKKRKEYSCDNK